MSEEGEGGGPRPRCTLLGIAFIFTFPICAQVIAGDALHAIELANEVLAEDNSAPMDLPELLRRARLLPPSSTPPAAASTMVEACVPPPPRSQPAAADTRPRSPSPVDQEAIACQ